MKEARNRYQKIIDNIEINMIEGVDKIWIKITPAVRVYNPSSIHFILNNDSYNFELYDKKGIESHQIYFEGLKCNPSFCLNSGENSYRIDFKDEGIIINSISDTKKIDDYIKKHCNIKCSSCSCWAKVVYYTSRPDKPPFDEM